MTSSHPSRAAQKWRCVVCETEMSGGFAHILRHLNARRLKQGHELGREEICEVTPRVGWCEGCKTFIDDDTRETHLQLCARGMY